jgi:hypothetical protein
MSAEPAPPGPPDDRYEVLEARVARLEAYRQHVLPHELAATHNAVSLVHAGTDEVRAGVADLRNRVIQLGADVHEVREAQLLQGDAMATLAGQVGQQGSTLASHGEMLAEILRRLPPPAE